MASKAAIVQPAPAVARTRRFSVVDQQWFAEVSGDNNPLHVAPEEARRLIAGDAVVHGIHALLWTLDAYAHRGAAYSRRTAVPTALAVEFLRPITVRESVRLVFDGRAPHTAAVVGTSDGVKLLSVTLRFDEGQLSPPALLPNTQAPWPEQPRDRRFDELAEAAGCLSIPDCRDVLRERFPFAAALFGGERLSALAALSRLIGTECPGLRSLFSQLSVSFRRPGRGPATLSYAVLRAQRRYAPVIMRVECPAFDGTVAAFVRPAPMSQPSIEEVSRTVDGAEFAGQRAWVIGGSRGLGETTAKIVACGGGLPMITFNAGEADAARVVSEIRAKGFPCVSSRLDVLRPGRALRSLFAQMEAPTHVYYFATPRIGRRPATRFNTMELRKFLAVYVDGFVRVVESARAAAPESPLTILYPSTVFLQDAVSEHPEYTAAKAAAEQVCRWLAARNDRMRIVVRRLPRTATDQNAGLLPRAVHDPVAVMLPLLRELN